MHSVFFAKPSEPATPRQSGWRWWFHVWVPVAIAIAVICVESTDTFSAQNTSSWLRPIVQHFFGVISDSRWDSFHHYLRKSGHFVGYGAVGFTFLRAWLHTLARRGPATSISWRLESSILAIFSTAIVARFRLSPGGMPGTASKMHSEGVRRTLMQDQGKIKKTDPDKRYRRVLSASTLAGDEVKNSAGEDLGKVDEIMIDIVSGKVAYAVLSFGGFLGMGNKLFAVPWSALRLNEDKKHFVLDVDKKKLENAPGFDNDNWPDMADTSWGTQISSYYGAVPYWEAQKEERTPRSGGGGL